jgi:hypothetical protein
MMEISAREKVRLAYEKGITDREALYEATRVGWDDLTDAIADLNDDGVIKFDKYTGRFSMAA